jgi:hypothetical protein
MVIMIHEAYGTTWVLGARFFERYWKTYVCSAIKVLAVREHHGFERGDITYSGLQQKES